MLEPANHSPATIPVTTPSSASVSAQGSTLRAGAVPVEVRNAPVPDEVTLKAGMPCYGALAPPGIDNLLSAHERAVINSDYDRYRGYLNNPDWVVNFDVEHLRIHEAYRVLCTQFEQPGRYAIRQAEQGAFMLVHRSRRAPQLVRTALEHSARGWHLDVSDTANSGWNGVRGRHFDTLEALKAALPRGMHEVAGASLHDREASGL